MCVYNLLCQQEPLWTRETLPAKTDVEVLHKNQIPFKAWQENNEIPQRTKIKRLENSAGLVSIGWGLPSNQSPLDSNLGFNEAKPGVQTGEILRSGHSHQGGILEWLHPQR